jgi:hypothetical protein
MITRTLSAADQLVELADDGCMASEDVSCAVLYGIVRDCAHKIRTRAEQERDVHRAFGTWDGA